MVKFTTFAYSALAAFTASQTAAHPAADIGLNGLVPHDHRGGHKLMRRGDTKCPQRRSNNPSITLVDSNNNSNADDGSSGVQVVRQPLFTAKAAFNANSSPALTSSSVIPPKKHHHHYTSSSVSEAKVAAPTSSAQPAKSSASASSSSSSAAPAQSPSSDTISSIISGAGLFGFSTPQCGLSGATSSITKTTGPNGAMDFLNCGLYSSGGWTPPMVTIDQISAQSLDEAIAEDGSPFKACKPYVSLFDKYAAQNGLPPILVASIAMQESSCNAGTMGDNGGAYGLMQITQDKCTSGINCADPDYNIKTGVKYLKSRLDANNGNILLALGEYNGWYKGLTVPKATAIKSQCCECQNNLNYLHQMLNGWLQNTEGYKLGDWVMGC